VLAGLLEAPNPLPLLTETLDYEEPVSAISNRR
jgi:hypothetical protein